MKTRKRYLWGKLEPTKESLEDFLSVLDEVTQDIYDDLRNLGGDLSGTLEDATVEKVGGKTKDEVADAVNKRHFHIAGEAGIGLSGWVSGTTNLPHNTWVNTQYVTLSSKGTYLIISNFRIRGDGGVSAYVKARLRWTDSANRETEHRMVCERIQPTLDFFNYGGCVSWIISIDQDNVTVYADYLRYGGSADDEFRWYNDGNGVPRLIAIRLYD